MSSELERVLSATAELVREVREYAPGYANGRKIAGTEVLAEIHRHTGTRFRERRYEVATAMALPYRGGQLIALDPARNQSNWEHSHRHELAHVIAGEVGYFLTSEDSLSFSERRADLFSLVDLMPSGWLAEISARRKFLYIVQEMKQYLAGMTEGWSQQRLWDRAKLRVLLFRHHEI